ncbi:MAG: aminotransferase class V-fold PLP-dependent enzyme [Clostridia bacterium]|nr:aminotransferase class V-fold PLP-dependent enzyme [Clostridia bacterium]
MNTPICNFVKQYAESGTLRLHMPGHKGQGRLGPEALDITEICGADSLYEANGVILESEKNASRLFGCKTFYSTEGSSLCIRAMLYLCVLHAKERGKRPLIYAARNAHKTFLSAVALLGMEVRWLLGKAQDSYLSCTPDAETLERILSADDEKPIAVYLTSPDYLGNVADIHAIAKICHRHGVWLVVDNAHGAYLKFLPRSQHPIDLGADLCCDSAHKTLPVLTGGAYLHVSQALPAHLAQQVKNALALFGSTSPSYLILQSLDAANPLLSDEYPRQLAEFLPHLEQLCVKLTARGYALVGNEMCKLTLATKRYGYTGLELSELLRQSGIECEFADPDFVVLMPTPQTGIDGLLRLEQTLCAIPKKAAVLQAPPRFVLPERVLSIREATLAACEVVPVGASLGRILATATVSCPPAVPIVVSGERIDGAVMDCFSYYGIKTCCVVKNDVIDELAN